MSDTGKSVTTISGNAVIAEPEQTIRLGHISEIDVSGLSPEDIAALKRKQAENMLEVQKKGMEVAVDVNALSNGINVLSEQTDKVAKSGNHITVAHSQTSSFGRTEIKMGNTQDAQSGKLSRSQTGERDMTLVYVGIGAVVLILLAFIFAR